MRNDGEAKYLLSFTTGGLFAAEAATTAPLYLAERDWDVVRTQIKTENALSTRLDAALLGQQTSLDRHPEAFAEDLL